MDHQPTDDELQRIEEDGIDESDAVDLEDSVKLYLKDIGRIPRLSDEETTRLARLVRDTGDLDAQKRLIEANLRLVVSVARKYSGLRGTQLLDAIQEGSLRLIDAVKGFDPDRGNKFSTYAVWWLRQGALNAVNQQPLITIPPHMRERARIVKRVQARHYQERGDDATMQEIVEGLWLYLLERYAEDFQKKFFKQHDRPPTDDERGQMDMSEKALYAFAERRNIPLKPDPDDTVRQIKEALQLVSTVPLEVRIDDQGNELGDVIAAPEQAGPRATGEDIDTILAPLERRREDGKFIYADGPKLAAILRARAGISNGGESMRLIDVGKELGQTRERVRQLEEKAIRRLSGRRIHELLGEE